MLEPPVGRPDSARGSVEASTVILVGLVLLILLLVGLVLLRACRSRRPAARWIGSARLAGRPAPHRHPAASAVWELAFTTPVLPPDNDPSKHHGGLDVRLVAFIDRATTTLDMADYDFDLENVANAMAGRPARRARAHGHRHRHADQRRPADPEGLQDLQAGQNPDRGRQAPADHAQQVHGRGRARGLGPGR